MVATENGAQVKGWVPISEISNFAIMAVIASEDTSFFSHKGIDFNELKEAIKKDLKEKRWARGASTLTQQVVKNVYLGREKTLWRKLKEFFWARELEKAITKTEIINFYLNMVEWGPDIYGISEAARHYFNTTPSALTAKQGAFLAMLLPSPIKYHSYFRKKALTDWAQDRVDHILKVMNAMGFIDDETYQTASAEPLWEAAVIDTGAGQGVKETVGPPPADTQANDDIEVPSAEKPSLETPPVERPSVIP